MNLPDWLYRGFGAAFMIVGTTALVYYLIFPPQLTNLYELIAKYVIPLGLIYFGTYVIRGKDIPAISK